MKKYRTFSVEFKGDDLDGFIVHENDLGTIIKDFGGMENVESIEPFGWTNLELSEFDS